MPPFDKDSLTAAARRYGTPLYVYSREYLKQRAVSLLKQAAGRDCLVRYAVKANPHPQIIRLFDDLGLHFDASSAYEAEHLLKQGIEPAKISLSSQQPPANLAELLNAGIKFVAASLHQLDLVGETGWQGDLAVRLNPGAGAGHNNRTTTAGVSAGFGIWHEYIDKVNDWQKAAGCRITRLHIHIGSGGDSTVWRGMIKEALELAGRLPDIDTLDMGGGYKTARMPDETEADMTDILRVFDEELVGFKDRTGRRLKLEIEPGTWLAANAGVLAAKIVDISNTGPQGYNFLKLDTGMNDFLRPTLYGAQHSIEVLNDSSETAEYVVIGHNCESGDILTPAPGDPERILPRRLNRASIGDLAAIGGAGAYAASMRAVGYNSYPPAAEVFI